MDIGSWINQARDLGISAFSQATGALGAGAGYVKSTLGQTWVFGSTSSSSSYDQRSVDEKHYFLMPDRRSEIGYSLYVMRCLPEGIPPINDLPKHRLIHLASEQARPTLEHILLADARETAEGTTPSALSVGARLNDIADQIDQIDNKAFNGVLLIGGLVALINPLAGAAIAVKALLPSLGMLLSKHGLKYVGDTANALEMSQRIKAAEKDVLKQFRGAGTEELVNPLLAQLDRALDTDETQYEPILEFDAQKICFGERDRERLFRLTCEAITNTYEEVIDSRHAWKSANLGPEDIRFLKLIRELSKSPTDDE